MTLGSFLTARDRLRQSPGLATAGPRWAGDQMESHTSSVAQPPSSLASCSPVPGALTHPRATQAGLLVLPSGVLGTKTLMLPPSQSLGAGKPLGASWRNWGPPHHGRAGKEKLR